MSINKRLEDVLSRVVSLTAAFDGLRRSVRVVEEEIYALKQRIDSLEIDSSDYDSRLDELET